MDSYPYKSIVCNGRPVSIDDIINRKAPATTAFEEALFGFMRQWLSDVDEFLLTTSGSTGTPKSIVVTRGQMIASAQLTSKALHLKQGQTALICLNPEYIAGKMMIVRSLVTGLTIIAVNPASNPLRQVAQHVDFAAMVPLQVHELLHAGSRDAFQQLSTVIIGGGAIDAQDLTLLQDLPCRFYATYGMTETVSHVALRQLNGDGASEYYLALPGINFSLDARGCLIIHWPDLGDAIVTNDLVQLEDDGRFIWLGRWDNLINSGGIKIIPEKLEATIANVLRNAGHHARFFVSSVPDARLGRKVV
ncbi:MAG TPA: AMP-binding protein, partial [Chryseolinea sp.]|nr:AMP-binding protein [Chryseolinea sp.]